jgi:hypothetical protein
VARFFVSFCTCHYRPSPPCPAPSGRSSSTPGRTCSTSQNYPVWTKILRDVWRFNDIITIRITKLGPYHCSFDSDGSISNRSRIKIMWHCNSDYSRYQTIVISWNLLSTVWLL